MPCTMRSGWSLLLLEEFQLPPSSRAAEAATLTLCARHDDVRQLHTNRPEVQELLLLGTMPYQPHAAHRAGRQS